MILNIRKTGKCNLVAELQKMFDFHLSSSNKFYDSKSGWIIMDKFDDGLLTDLSLDRDIILIGEDLFKDPRGVIFFFPDNDPVALEFFEAGNEVYTITEGECVKEVVQFTGLMHNYSQYALEGGMQHIQRPYENPVNSNVRGWGRVWPTLDIKKIAPLCRYPYHGHKTGCHFCNGFKTWKEVMDPSKEIYALYFTMDISSLWSRLRENHPDWTEPQIRNVRYWTATKKKMMRELTEEFLDANPGQWVRALNRAPGHHNYTWGVHYNEMMKQIGIILKWPPEPYPVIIEIVGRPLNEGVHPAFYLRK